MNTSFIQKTVALKEIEKFIGERVKVEGIISGVKTYQDAKCLRTLVNVGGEHPNQLLTVVVFSDYKTEVIELPSAKNINDIVIVTGRVELYKGKAQIVVRAADQLQIVCGLLCNGISRG